jgi:hypothetical protein
MMLRSLVLLLSVSIAESFSNPASFVGKQPLGLSATTAKLTSSKAMRSGRSALSALSMAEQRRVVVTGMGITSCLGNTLDEVADSLYNARFVASFTLVCAHVGLSSLDLSCMPPPHCPKHKNTCAPTVRAEGKLLELNVAALSGFRGQKSHSLP